MSRPGRSAIRQPRGVTSTGDVDQQRRRAADHVGARAAAGELGQERQVGQLVEDQPGRLHRVAAGHRPDPGRGAWSPRKSLVSHAAELSRSAAAGDSAAAPRPACGGSRRRSGPRRLLPAGACRYRRSQRRPVVDGAAASTGCRACTCGGRDGSRAWPGAAGSATTRSMPTPIPMTKNDGDDARHDLEAPHRSASCPWEPPAVVAADRPCPGRWPREEAPDTQSSSRVKTP